MNLYLLTQDEVRGFDSFDAAVVAAESPEDARLIHPCGWVTHVTNDRWMGTFSDEYRKGEEHPTFGGDWPDYVDIDCIKVEELGPTHKERGVILASFNAG